MCVQRVNNEMMLVVFQSQEPKTFVKSTGVFQDEELLFSQTQQRDNDPEVDLFASSAKPSVSLNYFDKEYSSYLLIIYLYISQKKV